MTFMKAFDRACPVVFAADVVVVLFNFCCRAYCSYCSCCSCSCCRAVAVAAVLPAVIVGGAAVAVVVSWWWWRCS